MLYVEATIGSTTHRLSNEGKSDVYWWEPYVLSFSPPINGIKSPYGGWASMTFGDIEFSPELFSGAGDWPPPDDFAIKLMFDADDDYSSADTIFEGTASFKGATIESVRYDLYEAENSVNLLSTTTDYNGDTVPLPVAFGSVCHARPVREADGDYHKGGISATVFPERCTCLYPGSATRWRLYFDCTGISAGDTIIIEGAYTADLDGEHEVQYVYSTTYLEINNTETIGTDEVIGITESWAGYCKVELGKDYRLKFDDMIYLINFVPTGLNGWHQVTKVINPFFVVTQKTYTAPTTVGDMYQPDLIYVGQADTPYYTVYEGGTVCEDITDNGDGTFLIGHEPSGEITISGTGADTDLQDVMDWAATQLSLTLDDEGRSTSPAVDYWASRQMPLTSFLDGLLKYYTHMAYIDGSYLRFMEMQSSPFSTVALDHITQNIGTEIGANRPVSEFSASYEAAVVSKQLDGVYLRREREVVTVDGSFDYGGAESITSYQGTPSDIATELGYIKAAYEKRPAAIRIPIPAAVPVLGAVVTLTDPDYITSIDIEVVVRSIRYDFDNYEIEISGEWDIVRAYFITAAAGIVSLSGADVTLTSDISTTLSVSAGSVSVSGTTATLTYDTGYDADAQDYIDDLETAGATLATAEKAAINTWVEDGKDDGWWAEIVDIWFLTFGSAAANAVGVKGTNGTFSGGGWDYQSEYIQGNGTTDYFETDIVPSTDGLSTTSMSLFFYTSGDVTEGSRVIGARSATQNNIEIGLTTNSVYAYFGNSTTAALTVVETDTGGIIMANKDGSSAAIVHKNTSAQTTLTSSTTLSGGGMPNIEIYASARNSLGSAQYFGARELSMVGVGNGLSSAEYANFLTSTYTLLDALGVTVV